MTESNLSDCKAAEVDGFYQKQAKELVNLLFDKKFLNEDLTRESIEWLETYLGFVLASHCAMAAKTAVLTAKMRDKK